MYILMKHLINYSNYSSLIFVIIRITVNHPKKKKLTSGQLLFFTPLPATFYDLISYYSVGTEMRLS